MVDAVKQTRAIEAAEARLRRVQLIHDLKLRDPETSRPYVDKRSTKYFLSYFYSDRMITVTVCGKTGKILKRVEPGHPVYRIQSVVKYYDRDTGKRLYQKDHVGNRNVRIETSTNYHDGVVEYATDGRLCEILDGVEKPKQKTPEDF